MTNTDYFVKMKRLTVILILFTYSGVFAQTPELIFNSGFEPAVDTIEHDSSSIDIFGIDGSVSGPNDWEVDLEDHPNIGYFKIQFKGGDENDRLAEIVDDPLDATNKALQFRINNPNSGNNGRIQSNLYNNNGIHKLFYSIRLFLPVDFNILKEYPDDFTFLTLMEFWNNANWTEEDYMFRVKANLVKITEDPDSLRIRVTGQIRDLVQDEWGEDIWEFYNNDYVVPVHKWMTLRVYFVEGDDCSGRFILTITPDGETETIVHNVRNFTHHPEDPSPDGLSQVNPFKLYTDNEIVEYVKDNGGLLNVFWDDFEIWKDSVLVTNDACLSGGTTFSSQSQIDNFATNYPACKNISGDVIIQSGGTDITNLNGLSQITAIQGNLKIESNNSLTSLAGLENLNCVNGYLDISSNNSLSDISALTNLRSLNGYLKISGNGDLASLTGLGNLGAIAGFLEISENDNLTSLTGLEAIDYTTITDLTLRNCSSLSFCELENICLYLDNGGFASIEGNDIGCNNLTEVEGACLAVLPVELSHFSGKEIDGNVYLSWQTLSEIANDYFQLEQSIDGKDFRLIGIVQGNSTISTKQDYLFVHTRPAEGLNYYRLKQVDFDGGYEYSNIISIKIESNEIIVQPNPTAGIVEIKGELKEAALKITDGLGRLVKIIDLSNYQTIDLSDKPKGIYFFVIQSNAKTIVKKIVKE